MPLEPYQYQPVTPPQASFESRENTSAGHIRNISGSSSWSLDLSPASVQTNITTPSRSPIGRSGPCHSADFGTTITSRSPIRQHGPTLLPRIRTQDQSIEPSFRALPVRPAVARSTTSPPECISLISPTSDGSNFSSGVNSAVSSPITITPSHLRGNARHARSVSTSGIDDGILRKYGYPYNRAPTYIGAQWGPSVIPGSSTFIAPPIQRLQPQVYETVSEELVFQSADEPASTLTEYFTAPNPAINIVREVNTVRGRGINAHFWWDIRNLRTWEDFNVDTIHGIRSFPQLLEACIPCQGLPTPVIAPQRLKPDSEAALRDVCNDFYVAKVNAAMKVSLGHINYLCMRAEKSRDGPHFVSNYQNDMAKTLAGNGRGRIVGIVKSYEEWNTGMRSEAPHRRVKYLGGLSHLHRYMREHECRYGFIITEIELVCVRAGTERTPYFGFLELGPTIALATQEGLTACLALWYLHMLAKDQPLPGQCGWRLDVGAPAAMTRMHVMEEKDDWIPDPQVGEKRDAKRMKGWVMPSDPWNKRKETAKGWNK